MAAVVRLTGEDRSLRRGAVRADQARAAGVANAVVDVPAEPHPAGLRLAGRLARAQPAARARVAGRGAAAVARAAGAHRLEAAAGAAEPCGQGEPRGQGQRARERRSRSETRRSKPCCSCPQGIPSRFDRTKVADLSRKGQGARSSPLTERSHPPSRSGAGVPKARWSGVEGSVVSGSCERSRGPVKRFSPCQPMSISEASEGREARVAVEARAWTTGSRGRRPDGRMGRPRGESNSRLRGEWFPASTSAEAAIPGRDPGGKEKKSCM